MLPIGAVTVMFGVFTLLLLILGWQNEEVNRKSIARHEDSIAQINQTYLVLANGIRENCIARNRNVSRFNLALEMSATAGVTDPNTRAKNLARIEKFKLIADDCSRYP